jgi:hypothetical protein
LDESKKVCHSERSAGSSVAASLCEARGLIRRVLCGYRRVPFGIGCRRAIHRQIAGSLYV